MKDHNYITIQGWMVNKLGLSGNELMVYAIIYGFCQDETDPMYRGSGKYIADSLIISKRQVFTILDKLVEKGYIKKFERFERNLKFCDYAVSADFLPKDGKNGGSEKTSPVMKLLPTGGDEETSPVVKKLPEGDEISSSGGDEKTSPHITTRDIYNHTTTTAGQPYSREEPPREGGTAAVAALSPEDIKQAILALDRSLLLKTDFYSRAAAFMALKYLDKNYLFWLYRQVELRNPNHFDGLFFTLFFEENMVEKYKVSKQPAKPPPPVEVKCPVCGSTHDIQLEECPVCSLPKETSSEQIPFLKNIPPEKIKEYLTREREIIAENGFGNSEKVLALILKLKTEYGVKANHEEPSRSYRS